MKLLTCMSAGAFILFSAFYMKQQNNSQSSPLYDIKWSLKKIHAGGVAEEINTNAFIQFNAAKKSAGGNGSCNSFGSSITVNGRQISFKNIFSTKMYCDGVQQTEDAFFKQLERVNRFETGAKTLLLYNGDEIVLEFQSE